MGQFSIIGKSELTLIDSIFNYASILLWIVLKKIKSKIASNLKKKLQNHEST